MPSLSKHQSNQFTKLTPEEVAKHFGRTVTVNDDGCWLWGGVLDHHGYARYGNLLVHAWTFRMDGNALPPGTEHCHTCKPKNCINPNHLYAGTHKQNIADAEMPGPRKLSLEDIETVRRLLKTRMPNSEIAVTVGVSPQWITKFLRGEFKYAQP